jgi:hypothetical protein
MPHHQMTEHTHGVYRFAWSVTFEPAADQEADWFG